MAGQTLEMLAGQPEVAHPAESRYAWFVVVTVRGRGILRSALATARQEVRNGIHSLSGSHTQACTEELPMTARSSFASAPSENLVESVE